MFLEIFCERSSSAAEIFGNANLLSTYIVMPNAISVQIINPMPGWTRKLPPPSSSAATGRAAAMMEIGSFGLEEEGDQAEDKRVERAGLGEGEAEPADALRLVRHL